MKREEIKYNTILSPFKWFILENFPYIEEDFDALTNWQLFCKIGKEINKIIEKVNLSGEQVEILTNSFNDLKEYIDNYFENLDVQEEINNKLDEMAEGGELAEIIAQYLSLAGCLAFKTLNDLKNATNLVENSICMTFGKNTYNDGKGEHYLIRTITSSDIVDNDNIVAVNFSNTLIAEKQHNARIEELESLNNKITILIGDSYGYDTDGWCEKFKLQNNLSEGDNVYTVANGGYGFIGDNSQTFLSELQTLENTITNKNRVDKIIVCGGWNDRGHATDIETAINSFMTYVKTNYPKAHVYCGMIANYKTINDVAGSLYWRPVLQKAILREYKKIEKYGGSYLNGVECVMHIYDRFKADDIHPTENGNIEIARAITQALYNGTFNSINATEYISIDKDHYTLGSNILDTTNFALSITICNNIVHTEFNGAINTNNISTTYTSLNLQVCQYTNDQKYFRFVDTNSRMNCTFAIKYNSTNYKILPGYLCFERDGYLHLRTRSDADLTNISEITVIANNTSDNYLNQM